MRNFTACGRWNVTAPPKEPFRAWRGDCGHRKQSMSKIYEALMKSSSELAGPELAQMFETSAAPEAVIATEEAERILQEPILEVRTKEAPKPEDPVAPAIAPPAIPPHNPPVAHTPPAPFTKTVHAAEPAIDLSKIRTMNLKIADVSP